MADVSNTLPQWSTTASSNAPADATSVGSGLGDNLRTIQAVVRSYLSHYNAVAIASASTTDLGANTGLFQEISGTTTIASFGTVSAGTWKIVRFQGALTITYNATSLVLPGAVSRTTAAGDVMLAYSRGSGNWTVPFYQKADGVAPVFIHGLTEDLIPDSADEVPVYDISDGANRKMTLANVLKVIPSLTQKVSPSYFEDILLIYDTVATQAKWTTLASFGATTTAVGVSELATTGEIITGTDTTRTMTPGDFSGTKSLATSGYYRFPGFIVQWGQDTLVSSGADITFPIAFPTACLGFTCSPVGASAPGTNNIVVHTVVSTSVFRLWAGVSQTVQWIAVGY